MAPDSRRSRVLYDTRVQTSGHSKESRTSTSIEYRSVVQDTTYESIHVHPYLPVRRTRGSSSATSASASTPARTSQGSSSFFYSESQHRSLTHLLLDLDLHILSPLRNLSGPPLEIIPEEYVFGPIPGGRSLLKFGAIRSISKPKPQPQPQPT